MTMEVNDKIRTVFALALFAFGCQQVSTDGNVRLDVFHEVLEKHQVDGSTLPTAKVEEYFDAVLNHFLCKQNGSAVSGLETETTLGACQESLCLDTDGLINIAGGDPSQGLTEEQFHSASLVALYLLAKGQHPCGATLNPNAGSLTLTAIRNALVTSIGSGGKLSVSDVDTFLHELEDVYEGVQHDHDDDHEDHDDDHHDDDHDDHGHSRKKRSGDDDDHGDEHEDGHDDHDDHGHEDEKARVMEAMCLSADAVMYYMNIDEEETVDAAANIDDFATIVVYLMSQGSALEESCRSLPKATYFIETLTEKLAGHPGNISQGDLTKLMDELAIAPTGEGEDDHAGHDHARRRRSVSEDRVLLRVRRQAPAFDDTKCYTQAELSAIFDLGDTLTPEELTQLSPALLYQKLYGQCVLDSHSETSSYKWLYGIVTVFIVCLCSLLGVMLVPCMGSSAYKLVMALFVGLAVGSLIGDAILHLIPSAMGAHAHGDGHGHNHAEGPIVVEKYVWFALVIVAGIYGFFLLETIFTRLWNPKGTSENTHGHSHDLELSIPPETKGQADSKEEVSTVQPTGNMSLTVMIVLGDAVHNFADGLAIGAAFSSSTGVGIATGIAVFCHELPHELGDFAVLLKNGLTVLRAVFWNVMSSLTAFLGLFISLAVATDEEVQTWIFAIAAGMFLYISMADLLPQMTARENCQDTPVFLLNNLGMLLGIFIMLLIAIFEERIVIE